MFHILIKDSRPNYLTNYNDTVSTVECGLKGGEIREAISQERFNRYKNDNKLNKERLCKLCARKLGLYISRESS